MPYLASRLSFAALLLCVAPVSASGLLIDDFTSNGGVSDPAIGLVSPGATGPTNKLFTGLGTNAIGDRTTFLEVVSPGVPSGGDAYVEPTGLGAALFYNSGLAPGVFSSHSISWAAGNFDLLTAVGVSSPGEMFFKLDFGENNFPRTATQLFEVTVFSAGGSALYSATVASNALISSNFTTLLTYQSGVFNATNVSIRLKADLAFAGGNNQVEFTGVSVVPEPSTYAFLVVSAACALLYGRLRRQLRR